MRDKVFGVLAGRDWFYLLALFVPLFVYSAVFRVGSILVRDDEARFWSVAGLLWSDALFALGFGLFWVGVFVLLRGGIPRFLAALVMHFFAVVIVIISACAYQYLHTTGTTLDYSVVVYYVTTPEEATGAVSSESSALTWAALAAAVLYAAIGPLLLTRLIFGKRTAESAADPSAAEGNSQSATPDGGMTRGRFIAAGVGAGAGVLLLRESLVPPEAVGQSRMVSRSAVSNLIATRAEELEMSEAAANVKDVLDLSRLKFVANAGTRKRHVALIHLESTRHQATTPYNPSLATMPYLAELSKKSLLVERAYTTTPHTSKAVTALHSGLYSNPDTDITESEPGGIPARCLPEILAEHGYRSAWFQSATETFENRAQHVSNFGYDYFAAFESMPKEGFQMSNYLGYEDDIMLGPSREWLEKSAGDPTFVMFLGVTPHHEYRPVERYGRKQFARGIFDRYLNNIYYDDFWVGNIIEQYKQLGLYEDTVFVIYGDHGEAFGEHGVKGHDGVPYEEGLRVPLVVHDPQNFDGGTIVRQPVQLTDFAPTIADMLGFEVTGGKYPGSSFAKRLPEDRVLRFSCRPDLVSMARIEGNEKYIYHYGKQPEEFYDLAKDPDERNNLAARVGRKNLDGLREDLLEWHAATSAIYGTEPGEKT